MSELLQALSKKEFEKYKAHLPLSPREGLPKETLAQHILLTQEYYRKIIQKNGIDAILESIFVDIAREVFKKENHQAAVNLLKEIFEATIVYHDLGKLNPNFQNLKMHEKNFDRIEAEESSNHAKLGSFAFFSKFSSLSNQKVFCNEEKYFLVFLTFALSFGISKHHSSQLIYKNEILDIFRAKFIEEYNQLLPPQFFKLHNVSKINESHIIKFRNKIFNTNRNTHPNAFLLFVLLKLNYSLLTASDYYATSHFMQSWHQMYPDFGVIDDALRKKIIHNIETSKSYNQKTYQEFDSYDPSFPQEANNDSLNRLRQNLAVEVIANIRKNADKNLFYIEAPTGGGKTNLSMLALSELLRQDLENGSHTITKVFYVFPFTTLITQTYKSLQETLGLDENEMVQIHSKAGFSAKTNQQAEEQDARYGEEKENIIDYQFINYPFALLSHIKFFNIVKSNQKAENYLLHRLANSVVIIDELQNYTPAHWDKIIYFINHYAKYFNIKFVLMSATLPKIDELISDKAEDLKNKFVYLIGDKQKYFLNPNFQKRVTFDFSLLEKLKISKENQQDSRDLFLEDLWEKIKIESELIKKESGRSHTIIEFILKKSAGEFLEIAEKNNESIFDEILLLSGTILEPRRREIIAKLKHLDYAQKNILLITTQVVEAGVDIDMDLGFKDTSLIDSDEQLAGRINRNSIKKESKLFLFNLDDAEIIYGKDQRFAQMQKNLTEDDHKKILEEKNFDAIYAKVMDEKNRHNEQSGWADNLPEYLKYMKALNFQKIHDEFQLIKENDNVTVFVPIEIPIEIPFSDEKNFSRQELEFLKTHEKYFATDAYVNGRQVFELYKEIIQNKNVGSISDFVEQKIQVTRMQSLLSKFSFSLDMRSLYFKVLSQISNIEEIYGFYYLQNVEDAYDYTKGIKNSVIIDMQDCIL